MQCTLAEAPVSQLERADVLDKLSDARRGLVDYFVTPGAAAAGLITLIARYAQLLGAVVIVGIVLGPLAAFLIAAAALVARFGNRGSLSRWSAAEATLLRDASGRCSTCHSRRSGSSR